MTLRPFQARLRSSLAATVLLICALLSSFACSLEEGGARHIVICIIDDFSNKDSHGERVRKIVEENSFNRCAVRALDINVKDPSIANGYLFALRNALTYATDHPGDPMIVNISLGTYTKHPEEEEVIRKLKERQVVIVASAGNDNDSRKLYPAAFPETIAVAATYNHRKADYSNFGDQIDIAAEGMEAITLSRREAMDSVTPEEKIYYQIKGGTSFAAPRVAGLLAYLLRERPDLDPDQAFEIMKKHATPVRGGGMNPPLAGVLEISLFSTLLHEDPLYRSLLGSQILSWILMLLLLYVCDKERALFYFGLIFLGPLIAGLNLVLIVAWGWIEGSMAGIASIVAAYLITCIYFIFKQKQKEQRKELDLEPPSPHGWG
ncbi:MAG: S8 family serine peptidase [Planctomycetota bacterium]